jgi:hypothetical protein
MKTATDANRDPITGEPGSHPVGTGVGTAGGALAGAAVGAVGGPVGSAVGAVVGGIAGAFAGHGIAESIDPTAEDAYWSGTYNREPYYESDYDFNDYGPAYRHGYTSRASYPERKWNDVENDLGRKWDNVKGKSRLGWDKAKHAARAAWNRVEDAIPGDADRDGH